ncbi:unnamed protein product, partial [Polarella glacialis]
ALLQEMLVCGVKPDLFTACTAIVSTRDSDGRWGRSLSLLHEMRRGRVRSDATVLGAVAWVLEKSQTWKQAVTLLTEMQQDGLRPDHLFYSSLISACAAENGGWHQALSLLVQMESEGLSPNTISFNAM